MLIEQNDAKDRKQRCCLQRHDRVQTESQIATVDSCFDLVGSLQHGVASCAILVPLLVWVSP